MRKLVAWIGAALLAPLALIAMDVLANWAWGGPSLALARLGPVLPSAAGLVAIGALLHLLEGGARIELWIALFVALASFAALYRVCSMSVGHPAPWPAITFTASAFVVVMPFAIAQQGHSDGPKIRDQAPIPGRIDLVLVEPHPLRGVGSRPGVPPGDLAQWDIRYTVARPSPSGRGLVVLLAGTASRGEALRALRTGRSPAAGAAQVGWRPGAQRAVVVLPGSPPSVGSLAAAAESLGAPAFALLTGATGSLPDWIAWAGDRGGDAATSGEMEGPTPVDSALRLVATSRAALSDRQLAYAYRPLLLFDADELYDWPVDVDAAFEKGKVRMCRLAAVAGETNCPVVERAADLDQSFDYLRVDPRGFSAADRDRERHVPGTAYYYRAVDGEHGHTYLDYWWYLPYNPSLSGWMCSLGFNLPEFDCFDHESDWEGVTVEVGSELGRPLAVYYAQHAEVIKRRWLDLLAAWRRVPQRSMVEGPGAFHPLVFVAGKSHASYGKPCVQLCVEDGPPLPEGSHNGGRPWPDDDDEICAGLCLKPLPVTRDGAPATWNAFSGTWGTRDCILGGAVCNRGEAPESPAFQWRYRNPGKTR